MQIDISSETIGYPMPVRFVNRLTAMTGPGLALQELMYGFIMELIFVTAARIGYLDYGDTGTLVLMILGMNATWGAIDAVVFYIIDYFSHRNHKRILDAARQNNDREGAVEYLLGCFGSTPLDVLRPDDERRICEMIIDCQTEDEEGMRRDRHDMVMSSVGCFLITLLTVVPVLVPILICPDLQDGLLMASVISSIIMFFVGYRMRLYYGVNGLLMGLFLTGASWAMTLIATFTGG